LLTDCFLDVDIRALLLLVSYCGCVIILCSITFLQKSCLLCDNVEEYVTARQATHDTITRRMRFACWITKATDTHSEYVILIAFPRQQWLREHSSMLRLYLHCLHGNNGYANTPHCYVYTYTACTATMVTRTLLIVTFIHTLPARQQWLLEHSSMLRLYLHCLHGNNGYANTPQCYVYTYTACTATMVTRTLLIVTFIRRYPVLYVLYTRTSSLEC
jgi:hypothetical protein